MFAVIIIVVFTIVVIFLFVKFMGNRWPWVWENIGRPLMNYFFVTSVRKVTIRYFSTIALLNIGYPISKIVFNAKTPNYQLSTAFELDNTILDISAIILSLLLTIGYILFYWCPIKIELSRQKRGQTFRQISKDL